MAGELWEGRFDGGPSEALQALNDSFPFDRRMFRQDIAGSRAHVAMLADVGLLTDAERDEILAALDVVEADDSLRPMYPDDLEPGKEALAYFLAQYWGGPTTYSDAKGHPRLRMRHVSFRITETERNAWLHHMTAAVDRATVDGAPLDLAARTQMVDYFTMAANHLINAE